MYSFITVYFLHSNYNNDYNNIDKYTKGKLKKSRSFSKIILKSLKQLLWIPNKNWKQNNAIFMLIFSFCNNVVVHWRFEKNDMYRLCDALNIPDQYTGYQGSTCTGMEALMVMLRRLSYPNRWCDLVETFGRSEPELSIFFNEVKIPLQKWHQDWGIEHDCIFTKWSLWYFQEINWKALECIS